MLNLKDNKPMNVQEFQKRLNKAFDDWCENGCVIELIGLVYVEKRIPSPQEAVQQGLTTDEAFDKYWDILEEKFEERLDKAVGGDWRKVGESLGYVEEDLEHIYVDRFQGKTDRFVEVYEQMMLDAGASE